jgi:ferredoxin-type protein NapH
VTAALAPGRDAVRVKGWLRAHRWLLTRRSAQLGFLAVFLTGPVAGVWITKGTLASSLTLEVLPLTDPLILAQSLAAGHALAGSAIAGAAIVAVAYLLLGGRAYCAWVCPVNVVTDAAHWLRERLGSGRSWQPPRATRMWLLGAVVLVSAVTGSIAWEVVNPVTALHRGIVFASLFAGLGWALVLAVFLFDVAVSRRGWCSRICPVGAFYGLLGVRSVLRVSAANRERCDDCMDCFAVCPEAQVIPPALHPRDAHASPLIDSGDCTNCGRCIDVCSKNVFRFTTRFATASQRRAPSPVDGQEKAA